MIINSGNVTAEEVGAIGSEFTTKYFDALMGKPNPSALRKFFNERSVYVFAQRGSPDREMHGLHIIGCFMKRMKYSQCIVTVHSVDTTTRPDPTEFTVFAVCELLRPGNDVPLNFAQTFVIKRVPWTRTEFQIVETQSKFNDEIEDDLLPIAVSVPVACMNLTTKTVDTTDNLRSAIDTATAVDDERKKSSPKLTDFHSEIINAETVTGAKREATEKPQIIFSPTNRVGKLKESTSSWNNPIRENVVTKEKTTSEPHGKLISPSTSNICNKRGAVIGWSKKVAKNPLAENRSDKKSLKGIILNISK